MQLPRPHSGFLPLYEPQAVPLLQLSLTTPVIFNLFLPFHTLPWTRCHFYIASWQSQLYVTWPAATELPTCRKIICCPVLKILRILQQGACIFVFYWASWLCGQSYLLAIPSGTFHRYLCASLNTSLVPFSLLLFNIQLISSTYMQQKSRRY